MALSVDQLVSQAIKDLKTVLNEANKNTTSPQLQPGKDTLDIFEKIEGIYTAFVDFENSGQEVVLQNASTAIGSGLEFEVGSTKTLTLEVTGTSTSRKVMFEGKSLSDTYYPVLGIKLQDYSMGSQTTGNGEIWSFDVTGLVSFRARIAEIAGGNVSVKGKAVLV